MSYDTVFENIVSGVLTGGATAVTAIMGFFRDTRKRVSDLESRGSTWDNRLNILTSKVGSTEGNNGLMAQMAQLRSDFDDWKRLPIFRTTVNTPVGDESYRLERVEKAIREIRLKVEDLESQISSQEKVFEESDEQRTEQIHKIREEIASVNGLMRGLSVAMGLIGSDSLERTKR